MKHLSRLLPAAACAVILVVFAGCKEQIVPGKNTIDKPEQFPDVMVGRWETKPDRAKSNWAFEFQPDGFILKMNHIMAGQVDLTEGKAYIDKERPGIRAEYFFLAPCKAKYDPATGEISVEVVVDNYRIQALETVMEGERIDIFRGPLSKDGKTWNAEWLLYFGIAGRPLNRDAVKPHPIVFTRVGAQ